MVNPVAGSSFPGIDLEPSDAAAIDLEEVESAVVDVRAGDVYEHNEEWWCLQNRLHNRFGPDPIDRASVELADRFAPFDLCAVCVDDNGVFRIQVGNAEIAASDAGEDFANSARALKVRIRGVHWSDDVAGTGVDDLARDLPAFGQTQEEDDIGDVLGF